MEFAHSPRHYSSTFDGIERRRTRIDLSHAEIELDTSLNTIQIRCDTGQCKVIVPSTRGGTHSGGDAAIMDSFTDAVASGRREDVLTAVAQSLDSHLLSWACEASRTSNTTITMSDFEDRIRAPA